MTVLRDTPELRSRGRVVVAEFRRTHANRIGSELGEPMEHRDALAAAIGADLETSAICRERICAQRVVEADLEHPIVGDAGLTRSSTLASTNTSESSASR